MFYFESCGVIIGQKNSFSDSLSLICVQIAGMMDSNITSIFYRFDENLLNSLLF